jgi:hypothetical protein
MSATNSKPKSKRTILKMRNGDYVVARDEGSVTRILRLHVLTGNALGNLVAEPTHGLVLEAHITSVAATIDMATITGVAADTSVATITDTTAIADLATITDMTSKALQSVVTSAIPDSMQLRALGDALKR